MNIGNNVKNIGLGAVGLVSSTTFVTCSVTTVMVAQEIIKYALKVHAGGTMNTVVGLDGLAESVPAIVPWLLASCVSYQITKTAHNAFNNNSSACETLDKLKNNVGLGTVSFISGASSAVAGLGFLFKMKEATQMALTLLTVSTGVYGGAAARDQAMFALPNSIAQAVVSPIASYVCFRVAKAAFEGMKDEPATSKGLAGRDLRPKGYTLVAKNS